MAIQRQNDTTPRASLKEVARALHAIVPDGQVFEIRAWGVILRDGGRPYIMSGYFNSPDMAIQAFRNTYEGKRTLETAEGIYITLNQVDPDLFARSANRLQIAKTKEATSDDDIVSRRWLFIDADPNKKSGMSSTEAEHNAALARIEDICAALASLSWLHPIIADSGNGAHALYRIDLPNNTESRDLIKSCLQALEYRFSDNVVGIDIKVENAARICKLYGSVARKGSHVPERPHRITRILDLPESPQVVTREQLEALAATLPHEDKQASPEPHTKDATFNLERWIADHNLDVQSPQPWGNGATIWKFNHCPFRPEEKDGGARVGCHASGVPFFGCYHDKCQGKAWRDLREMFEPGCYDRKTSSGKILNFIPHQDKAENDHAYQVTSHEFYDMTDTGNAFRLVDGYGHLIHFVKEWKQWIVWTGQRWEIDLVDTHIMGLAMTTAQHIQDQAQSAKNAAEALPDTDPTKAGAIDYAKKLLTHAKNSQNRRLLESMVALAKNLKDIAISADKLDADHFLVNVPNGTFDIRTGTLREHRRDDFITRMTRVSYDPKARAPRWEALVSWAMCERPDLIAYLQRAFGYGMCGSTRERMIFFEFGTGRNSKSVITEAVYKQLGDYAGRVAKETLLHQKYKSTHVDVAQLEGKRLVISGENNEGERLDEGTIKEMLSGFQHARALYSGYRNFEATYTIFYYTNFPPEIRSNDPSIWDRIAVIPFDAKALKDEEFEALPKEKQASATRVDTRLAEKLEDEAAGILRWALDGAVIWNRSGLGTCKEVRDATFRYRKDMDTTGQFLMQCTRTTDGSEGEHLDAGAKELYEKYVKWCESIKEYPTKQRAFLRKVEESGHKSKKTKYGYRFPDLQILDEVEWRDALWCTFENVTNSGATPDVEPNGDEQENSDKCTNAPVSESSTHTRAGGRKGDFTETGAFVHQSPDGCVPSSQAVTGTEADHEEFSKVHQSAPDPIMAAHASPVKDSPHMQPSDDTPIPPRGKGNNIPCAPCEQCGNTQKWAKGPNLGEYICSHCYPPKTWAAMRSA